MRPAHALTAAFPLSLALAAPLSPQGPLVIHEWGTFTSLQDESGRTLGWVNTDDEPVPEFVHRAGPPVIGPDGESRWRLAKSIPRLHPDVTMRLETPVLYFHPGPGFDLSAPVDVSVAFRGGWLTEFFPAAEASAPGFTKLWLEAPRLTADEIGTLRWTGLALGGEPALPETGDAVWLAPREVQSAPVTAANGEAERYLFYRGVGHLDAPLRVSRDPSGEVLELRSALDLDVPELEPLRVAGAWLVDVRPDGALAWREVPPFALGLDHESVLAFVDAAFATGEHGDERLAELRAGVLAGLVADGLFEDEALGLLNTWEHAYFRTPGLRLFFLVPQEWTDHVLPLETSVTGAAVVRAMVARIELVTPEQRAGLSRIAAGPLSEPDWLWRLRDQRQEELMLAAEAAARGETLPAPEPRDERDFAPDDYAAYLDLGRFRDALLLDALARAPALEGFIERYGLEGYAVEDEVEVEVEVADATAAPR